MLRQLLNFSRSNPPRLTYLSFSMPSQLYSFTGGEVSAARHQYTRL